MIQPLQVNNFRVQKNEIDPKVHETQEALQLKEACQQFESILWSKLWKEMRNCAREVGGNQDERPWAQMEDLSLEMASEDLVTSSGGAGLWRSLYDSMIGNIAVKQATEARLAKANGDWAAALSGAERISNNSNNSDNDDSDLELDVELDGLASRRARFNAQG